MRCAVRPGSEGSTPDDRRAARVTLTARIFQACLPIKYYNVWWSVGQKAPLESGLQLKRDNEHKDQVKNKQRWNRPPTPVRVTFLFWNSYAPQPRPPSMITLPAAATLNRAIQISCPKMASNYLFIGRWGGGGLQPCRGAQWWIEALVKCHSRKQLTQEDPFTCLPPEMPGQQGFKPGPSAHGRHPP